MSSKKRARSLHDQKTEEKSGLSRHYHEIGIKAGRWSDAEPANAGVDGDTPPWNSTEGEHNE